jgi:hypothetical protein
MGSRNFRLVAVLFLVSLNVVASEKGFGQGRVRASEIFPLYSGQLTTFDVFSTDTSGTPIQSSESFASTRVEQTSVVFEGLSNVSIVTDSVKLATSDVVNDVHYRIDGKGDVLAYADANFISLFAPASVAKSLTPPDSFVNYFMLSHGDKAYHMISLSQEMPYQTLTVTIGVELTGRFRGVEVVEVPGGRFDSAYHFTITANMKGSLHGAQVMNATNAEEIWLVRGVGIVKTNMPSINKGVVQVQGSERQMVGHWDVSTHAAVSKVAAIGRARLYPNPATNFTTIALVPSASLTHATLFNTAGQRVADLSIAVNTNKFLLDTKALPSGDYFIHLQTSNAPAQDLRLSISH